MRNLYLIRGVSGAGKSTFAKVLSESLNAILREADMYHYNSEGVYDWKPENLKASHDWCKSSVRNWMQEDYSGHPDIVVSNTFTTEKELQPYFDLAADYGYKVTSIIIENRHGGDSIHNVPESVRNIQENKLRNNIKLK